MAKSNLGLPEASANADGTTRTAPECPHAASPTEGHRRSFGSGMGRERAGLGSRLTTANARMGGGAAWPRGRGCCQPVPCKRGNRAGERAACLAGLPEPLLDGDHTFDADPDHSAAPTRAGSVAVAANITKPAATGATARYCCSKVAVAALMSFCA